MSREMKMSMRRMKNCLRVDNEKNEEEEVRMQWAILQSLYTLRCILVFYHRQWERDGFVPSFTGLFSQFELFSYA